MLFYSSFYPLLDGESFGCPGRYTVEEDGSVTKMMSSGQRRPPLAEWGLVEMQGPGSEQKGKASLALKQVFYSKSLSFVSYLYYSWAMYNGYFTMRADVGCVVC